MQLESASYGIQSRMSISPVDWIWYPNEGFYSSQCAQYYGSSRRFDQKGSEIARAHVGEQSGIRFNIEKLRQRVGTQSDLRRFKAELVKITKRKVQLPGYAL